MTVRVIKIYNFHTYFRFQSAVIILSTIKFHLRRLATIIIHSKALTGALATIITTIEVKSIIGNQHFYESVIKH